MDCSTMIVVRRKGMALRQQDLADVLKISRQHYASIEQGKVSPSLGLAFRLSARLGCSVYELFNEYGFARTWADSNCTWDYIRDYPNKGSYK